MRNARRAGNAMRAAMEMDGRRPPGAKIMQYGNSNTDTYRNTPEFMRGLEALGARGRVAEAYLGRVGIQTEFGTGETVVVDGIGYSITRTGKVGENQ